MTCASCGSDNRPGRRFCRTCGAQLAATCAVCGAANDPDDSFCGECGAGLQEAARSGPTGFQGGAGASSPAFGTPRTAERRHVTVLFADLVGFTTLSQARDAEDVRELLGRYFDAARTVITRYGGTVEKFIGDAVMAVWGVPAVQENDAERAVRAALELVDAVAALGEEVGAPGLTARAGVLTGEAAVTLGATGEGIVAGDLVNTASRVQSAAEPGTVYVGDSTRQATEAAIVYEDTGPHELKGKSEPARLWRARRVVAGSGGSMRPTVLEPPFVGRDRELRLLKEYLHATAEEGKARLLSVVGVGGVGKSRLAWEFEKYADGVSEVTWWHRGRCLAYGEGVAYWALSEMVRMRAGIVDNESPDAAREKLRQTVAEFVAGEEERRWVEPRLAHLVGLSDGAATDPRDLYAAWRFFFEQMAVQHVTTLIFEDLQWADSGLLDFIEYLLEWSRNSPILIITLARPELSDRRAGWGAGKRGLTSLYLEPLSAEAMGQLLEGLVPGLPDDLATRISERAAGIPLYAVETVRMLLDRGLLVDEGGVFRAPASLEALEVPESLHALIASRLDSLPQAERQLLQDASVLGKSFTAHALTATSGLGEANVEPTLAALVGRDLLTMQADPRSPERGQYLFVQDLVRSVAYGTLARRDRKRQHLAAAAYLESAWSEEEEVAAVVAAHLVDAHSAEPDSVDAPEIRDRARNALRHAGDHAASLGGANSAERYFERALEFADDDAVRADLLARVGEMAFMQGHADDATASFDGAISLHLAHGRNAAAARTMVQLTSVKAAAARFEEAIGLGERALALLAAADDGDDHEADIAQAESILGKQLYFLGEHERALERSERALDIAEPAGLHEVFAYALDTKGCILAARGRVDEAEILERAALKVALEQDLPSAPVISANAAAVLEEKEQLEAALACLSDGEALARRLGDRRRAVNTTLAQLPILLELGRWDEAAALYAQYVEVDQQHIQGYAAGPTGAISMVQLCIRRGDALTARRLIDDEPTITEGDPEARADYDGARAAVLNAEGHHAEALSLAEGALRACLDPSFPATGRRALVHAVDAAFALDRLDKVEELISVTRRRHRPGRQPGIDAQVLRWEARLAAQRGDAGEVVPAFTRSIEAFSTLRRPFWVAVVRLELGEWMSGAGRGEEATLLLAEARKTFEELRATPWIERADAVARAAPPAAATAMPA